MRPVLDKTTAVLDTAEVQFRVRVKIPDRVSEAYPMLPQSDGTLTFQPDCPENPRQMSLLPDDDDAPEAPEASQAPDDTDETVG